MPDKLYSQTYWDVTLNNAVNGDMCKIGTSNAYPLRFYSDGNEHMFLSTTGNFGIGITNPWTNNPSSLLSVGSTEGFQVNGSGNITKINGIDCIFPSIQASAGYILQNDGSGILTWVDPNILVTFNAWDLTGNASTNPSNDFIGTIDATDFVFRTNSVEKMRILSDGYIGIGINTPQSTLHIHSDEESGTTNTNPNGGGGSTRGQINLQQNNAVNSFQITNKISGKTENDGLFLSLYNKDVVLENKEAGYIKFKTKKMGLCVFPDGNVGIGTIQGDAKLNLFSLNENTVSIKSHSNNSNVNLINCSVTNANSTVLSIDYNSNQSFSLLADGTMSIIDASGDVKFKVKNNGYLYAKDITVTVFNFPDYVFEDDYSLMTISELEEYISINKHLPEIPSADEVEENGLSINETQVLLVKKIEELSLYIIQLNKEIEALKNENK